MLNSRDSCGCGDGDDGEEEEGVIVTKIVKMMKLTTITRVMGKMKRVTA